MEVEEKQVLDRLKRAIAHQKNETIISLRPKCPLIIGSNASLRVLQQTSNNNNIKNKPALLIVSNKINPIAKETILSVAMSMEEALPVWTPNITSKTLGGIVGLSKASCMACLFLQGGDSIDPLTSIRDFILDKLVVKENKRIKLKKED
jgi:hypothetical protein